MKEIPKQQQRSKIDPGNDHHHYYGYYGGGGGCWGLKKIHDLNAPYPYNHIIRATSFFWKIFFIIIIPLTWSDFQKKNTEKRKLNIHSADTVFFFFSSNTILIYKLINDPWFSFLLFFLPISTHANQKTISHFDRNSSMKIEKIDDRYGTVMVVVVVVVRNLMIHYYPVAQKIFIYLFISGKVMII